MTRRAQRIAAFRATAADRLSQLQVSWIQVESGLGATGAVDALLRDLHALKGETAVLELTAATQLIHEIELAVQRDPSEVGDIVLRAFDLLALLVRDEASASPPELPLLLAELAGTAPSGHADRTEPAASEPVVPAFNMKTIGARIATSQLEHMRDTIGDLMLLKIRLFQLSEELIAAGSNDQVARALGGAVARLRDDALVFGSLVGSLEATVRELRLVPVGVVLERYPRIARDLSRALLKQVRVEIDSDVTGVDREVIEAVDTALLHVMRNAIDHGLESPEARRAVGKVETGTIRIKARVDGSRFRVSISDDGAGIDIASVRRVAIERGIADPRTVVSDERALQWIMLPGFTTRQVASHVSGRGVGLDAVHASMQALGGSLEVETRRGQGTTFRLVVPISTAISSVLLFHVGDARYALPIGSVDDVVDAQDYRVDDGLAGPVITYRGVDCPLISLERLLEAPPKRIEHPRLVIVRTGLGQIACTGSEGHEHREAVVRPAGALLSAQEIATGAIVLEDGSVALLLNAARLDAARAPRPVVATSNERARGEAPSATVLVADDSPIIRDMIVEMIKSHGLVVHEAGDGVEALDQLANHPDISLLVTDVEMPRMGGLDLIRAVRQRPGARLPAVVVSTRGSTEDKQLASEIGADAYLVKTDLTHDSLWTLIARFVGRR